MKSIRWIFFAALTGYFVSGLKAQTIVLTGHVTDRTGIYGQTVAIGDQVIFSLDFSAHPPLASFDGEPSGETAFWVPFSLTVDTKNVVLGEDSLGVYIQHDNLTTQPEGEGLFIGTGWNNDDGQGSILQYFLSTEDIVPSPGFFPAGIPLSKFYRTDGFYSNETPGASGRIDWNIDRYTGSFNYSAPAPMSPIPEPSTYGIFAALGLVGLVISRRRAKFARR